MLSFFLSKVALNWYFTSHSAYVATWTKSDGVKIDGFLQLDSYIQILYRFQKCKQKVPPLFPLSTQKSPFTPHRMRKIFPWGDKG
jgi:hypothetical protein